MSDRLLLNAKEVNIILNRLACQLRETHLDFSNTVLIGLQPRGTVVAKRLVNILSQEYGIENIQLGLIDITFFRDDFRRTTKVLEANENRMEVQIEGKRVVLIDDVLYTGRSVRAALTAIDSYGRPSEIQLLTLIDRRFSRHLPIQPDFLGRQVDAIQNERVRVHWEEEDGHDAVYLTPNEHE
ncbi:MAG: bifunctional pyr operon transcriptional regulator/uracil phosphoribosyltransferase PyrR [Flavobacteriaceae bacterium]